MLSAAVVYLSFRLWRVILAVGDSKDVPPAPPERLETFQVHFQGPVAGFLTVRAEGAYSKTAMMALADAVQRRCRESGATRVLADLKGISGDFPDADRQELGVYCAQNLRQVARLAVFCAREQINWRFEDTAVRRNLATVVSDNRGALLQWLTSGPAYISGRQLPPPT